MTARLYVGVDPGPTPGVVVLEVEAGRLIFSGALQCSAPLLWRVLDAAVEPGALVAVERFVVRGRATKDQALTRDQVAGIAKDFRSVERSASQVKLWATDARLEAAGLLAACKGMRHARDAARHALFAVVHDGGLPDPMSKEWNR